MAASWRDRIAVNPNVCHGKACIRGSRVMVSVLLDELADGQPVESVARDYKIEPDDVLAAIDYAAELTRDRVVSLPFKN